MASKISLHVPPIAREINGGFLYDTGVRLSKEVDTLVLF
jgi:hypothetical protein